MSSMNDANRPSLLPLVWLLPLLAAVPLPAQDEAAPAPSEISGLEPVPVPDLEALEPAVREQLDEARAFVDAQVSVRDQATAALAEAIGVLGMHFHAYGLHTSAAPSYRNAALLAPNDVRWPYYLGELYQQDGYLEEAAEAYQRVIDLDPDDVPTLVRLAEIARDRDRLDEAAGYLEHALEVAPESAPAGAGMGELALAQGDAARAVELLEAALAQVPAATRLHHPLGLAYRQLGDLDRARAHLAARGDVGLTTGDPRRAAIAELATGERVNLLRGRQAFAAGRFQEAAAAFRAAVEADPLSARALVNLGTALSQTGDLEGATAALREALDLDPANAAAHYNLGVLVVDSDPEAALGHFQQAVAARPEDPAARRQLGRLLHRAGRAEEALEQLVLAVRADQNDEDSHLGLASIRIALGRYRDAVDGLDAAVTGLPHSGRLAIALARLLAASPDAAVRDGERALELSRMVFEATKAPEDAALVAASLAELERCEEAASVLREAVEALEGAGATARASALGSDLARYEKGRPCRLPDSAGAESQS